MRGLAEIVRANDDATNARTYRAALANALDAMQRGALSEAYNAIAAALEDNHVC